MKNKLLKKFIGWLGYKLIDKDYVKNNRIIEDKSFLEIDKILNYLVKNNIIKSLIQIGANDGQRFDSLNRFIKDYKIKSLLVEPIEEHFKDLKKNYDNIENIYFENSLISVNNEVSYLYKVNEKFLSQYGDHIKGISSFNYQHLIKHGVKDKHIIKQKANSISIKELLIKHKFDNFDLLFIDTEGYDGAIVNDFLINNTTRPFIIFEYIHINNETFKILVNNFKKFDYNFFPINENIICIPKEKRDTFIFQKDFE
jgi:FkbM family methyltransferase